MNVCNLSAGPHVGGEPLFPICQNGEGRGPKFAAKLENLGHVIPAQFLSSNGISNDQRPFKARIRQSLHRKPRLWDSGLIW